MYILPLWCSFLSFPISSCLGRFLGSSGVYVYTVVSMLVCSMCSVSIFYEVCISHSICSLKWSDWLVLESIDIKWGIWYDSLSSTMLIVVTIISLCAHVYSIEYMWDDPHKVRFFSYSSLFTFFMIFLVSSDNVLQLFVGWEGVGICSYLLVNFWATRIQANKSAILAVMTNKIGDIALLVGCILFYNTFKSVDFSILNSCMESNNTYCVNYNNDGSIYQLWNDSSYINIYSNQLNESILEYVFICDIFNTKLIGVDEVRVKLICVSLMVAAIGKSAQAGLHIWLPEAMEGPTPVSSLIHAATMVTAGIFLLVRCSYIFNDLNDMFIFFIFFGSITAFFSSAIGLVQTDIKKIVAYSTCSQLGYMFVCRGFSAFSNSMFHLFNHAFFKALLFLTAGYIIHALNNEQDIRKMGGLIKLLPFSYIMMLLGSLSILGFPYFSGFYSKDKIIELCFNYYIKCVSFLDYYNYIAFSQLLCILAVIFTLVYSIKLILYVFLNTYNGFKMYIKKVHFSSYYTQLPLFLLSLFSVFSGYITSDMMVGTGSNFWLNAFRTDTFFISSELINNNILLHTEFNHYIRQITVFWTLYFLFPRFIITTYYKHFLYYSFIGSILWLKQLYTLVNKKYVWINRLFIFNVINMIFYFSYRVVFSIFDKGFIEFVGPFGAVSMAKSVVNVQYRLQTGFIYHYAGFLLLTLIVLIHILLDFLIN